MSKINLQKSNQKTEVSFNIEGRIDTYAYIHTAQPISTGSSTEIKCQLPNVYDWFETEPGTRTVVS